jgi:hypothetical protein
VNGAHLSVRADKFSFVENPFKPNDAVMTLIKGTKVKVSVRQVWKREVQVKTADGTLLWRTMHTVWFPGSKPIPKIGVPNPVQASGREVNRPHGGTEKGSLPVQAISHEGGNGASHPTAEPAAAIAASQNGSSSEAATKEQKVALAKKRRARRLGKTKGN